MSTLALQAHLQAASKIVLLKPLFISSDDPASAQCCQKLPKHNQTVLSVHNDGLSIFILEPEWTNDSVF